MAKRKDDKGILLRLAEQRFERDLKSRREREARRHWATLQAQKDAQRRKEQQARSRPAATTVVKRKLKEESKERGIRRNQERRRRKAVIDLMVPENLDIFENYDQTANLLNRLRHVALKQRQPIRLNFDETKFVQPAAVLCLVSEIFRCRRMDKTRATGTYPVDFKVKRVLQDSGFFELLDVTNPLPPQSDNYPLEYIKVLSGVRAVGEEAEKLKETLLGDTIKMTEAASSKLYRGLTEAMTNVVHHAYPPEIVSRFPRLRNRWWLVGHVDKEQRELVVMFFDQGVGIPATLPLRHSELLPTILSGLRLVQTNDGDMIRAAMQVRRSQTQEAHRGRGLNDFRAFIDQCGDGCLRIVSRKGLYTYTPRDSEKSQSLNISLGGTLIEWKVPLDKISNWKGE